MLSDPLAEAIECFKKGMLADATRLAHPLCERQPDDPRVRQLVGRIEYRRGNLTGAVEHFQAGLRAWPDAGSMHGDLGIALMELGRVEDAVPALDAAIRLNAGSRQIWQGLGLCLDRLGRPDDARVAYRRMITAHVAEMELKLPAARPPFHFLRDNEPLSGDELARARRLVDSVKHLVVARDEFLAAHPEAADVASGASVWHRENPAGFELDGARVNYRRSFELVASGEPRILDQLRLYAQSFTGYQLATLSLGYDSAYIREPLPVDVDRLMLAPRARELCPSVQEYTFLRSYLLRGLPEVSFPAKFGEVGWRVGSAIVNYDLTYYLSLIADLRLAGLFAALVAISTRRPAVVLEIGGGFGGLAYLIRKLVPNSHYIVVDLPESLVFSVPYLGTLFPQDSLALVNGDAGVERPAVPGFTFVPNHRVDALRGANLRVDLAVNTMSMDEMAPHQVEAYGRLLSEVLADDASFFEVNLDHVVPPLSCHLRQIAPPSSWARSERAVLWRDTKKIRYWQA